VEFEDALRAELAAAALVGFSGVSEAVAEDDFAGIEGGLDNLGDGLGAVGKHEGHFSHGERAVERESSRRARMRSPVGVPPGWRVRNEFVASHPFARTPPHGREPVRGDPGRRKDGARGSSEARFLSQAAKRLIWVVLPEPSRPSRVIKKPRCMG